MVHVVGKKAFKPQDVGAQQGWPVPVHDEHVQLENACKAKFVGFLWLHRRRARKLGSQASEENMLQSSLGR